MAINEPHAANRVRPFLARTTVVHVRVSRTVRSFKGHADSLTTFEGSFGSIRTLVVIHLGSELKLEVVCIKELAV